MISDYHKYGNIISNAAVYGLEDAVKASKYPFGGYDDWNDRIYCIHGYKVTEKAIALDYWKSKHKQDEDDMRKLCELPIPEVTSNVD